MALPSFGPLLSWVPAIILATGFGAIGGFIASMLLQRTVGDVQVTGLFQLPHTSVRRFYFHLGFLGPVLSGAAAGFVGFLLLGPTEMAGGEGRASPPCL